ncbi:MAG: hypothetical protein V1800_18380 [Candidatus Latescibacterota bacterium]
MNEEQQAVLRMLSEGKITTLEAEELLEALGEPEPLTEPDLGIADEDATEETTEGESVEPCSSPEPQAEIQSKIAEKMAHVREKMDQTQEKVQRKMGKMHRKMAHKGFDGPEPPLVDVQGIVEGAMESVSESLRGVTQGMGGAFGKKGLFGEKGVFGKKGDRRHPGGRTLRRLGGDPLRGWGRCDGSGDR